MPICPLILAGILGLTISLRAQVAPTGVNNYNQANQGPNISGGAGITSDPTAISAASDSVRSDKQKGEDSEPATDPETGDSTLYRLKTTDSLAEGSMARSEGQLTRKPHKKEHVLEIDSTKLRTSGTDPKFQGSLLNNSVTSIDDVSVKVQAQDDTKDDGEAREQEDGESRFTKKHLVFKRGAEEKEKAPAGSSSSPSPSPSASASASPSSR